MLSKNGLRLRRTVIPFVRRDEVGDGIMMSRRSGDQASLFYEFRLDDRVPKNHLLRRINAFVTAALADVHEQLDPYYSEIGRLSVSTSRLSNRTSRFWSGCRVGLAPTGKRRLVTAHTPSRHRSDGAGRRPYRGGRHGLITTESIQAI